ncbi:MAG: dUTP diphosphatase [Leptospirales bacterium]
MIPHSSDHPFKVRILILDDRIPSAFPLPTPQTAGSAGLDLRAMIDGEVVMEPGARLKVPSGIAVHISDPGVAGFIVPRSGLGSRGLVLSNLTGILDSDYTGPVILALWNAGPESIRIQPGDRVAQLLFLSVLHPVWEVVENHHGTGRGGGGFGHTGN